MTSLPRDPKDEKYLDLAVAVGADCLVSRDNDLLDLMDAQRPESQAFRAAFPQITILDPVSFLRAFSKQTSEWPRTTDLYDSVVLPGVRQPMAVGFKTTEIERLMRIEDE